MKQSSRKRFIFLIILSFVLFNQIQAQTKNSAKITIIETCQVSKNVGGKYKFVSATTSLGKNEKVFLLTIKLNPKKFTREYLLQLAQRISETYCKEDKINAIILDSVEYKKRYDDLNPPPILPPATKAVYGLDRIKGEESIEFVLDVGKIVPEITDKIIIKSPENRNQN